MILFGKKRNRVADNGRGRWNHGDAESTEAGRVGTVRRAVLAGASPSLASGISENPARRTRGSAGEGQRRALSLLHFILSLDRVQRDGLNCAHDE
jgi:hypothetical protein